MHGDIERIADTCEEVGTYMGGKPPYPLLMVLFLKKTGAIIFLLQARTNKICL